MPATQHVNTAGLPPAPGVCPVCSGSRTVHLDGCPNGPARPAASEGAKP